MKNWEYDYVYLYRQMISCCWLKCVDMSAETKISKMCWEPEIRGSRMVDDLRMRIE